MTSEEYVNQVNRLIDLQNTYLAVFLTILIAGIGLVVLFQWRISTQQMKRLKEETKLETIREIEKTLGVSNISEFKKNVQNNFVTIEEKRDVFEGGQFDYELNKLYVQDSIHLWHITYLMDIYKEYILKSFRNFDYVVSRVSSLILVGDNENKLDINNQYDHIDNIIQKLTEFEKSFDKKSEKLVRMRNEIKFYRSQEKEK